MLGLVVALVRTSDAPALFPLRLSPPPTATRSGIRRLLGGLVGRDSWAPCAPWLPTDPVVLGGAALALSYGAYVAEVYRAESSRSTAGSATPRPRSG